MGFFVDGICGIAGRHAPPHHPDLTQPPRREPHRTKPTQTAPYPNVLSYTGHFPFSGCRQAHAVWRQGPWHGVQSNICPKWGGGRGSGQAKPRQGTTGNYRHGHDHHGSSWLFMAKASRQEYQNGHLLENSGMNTKTNTDANEYKLVDCHRAFPAFSRAGSVPSTMIFRHWQGLGRQSGSLIARNPAYSVVNKAPGRPYNRKTTAKGTVGRGPQVF